MRDAIHRYFVYFQIEVFSEVFFLIDIQMEKIKTKIGFLSCGLRAGVVPGMTLWIPDHLVLCFKCETQILAGGY